MAARKKAVRKKAATKVAPKLKAISTKQTKTQILQTIADETGMTRKDVGTVIESLGNVVTRHVMRRGNGEITVPGVGIKVRRVKKPAKKARKGINPFTGVEMMFKAKPACNVIKITALKALKDSVA